MKKYFNILFYAVLIYLIASKIPIWWQHYNMQTQKGPENQIQRLSGENITIPQPGQKTILVFWATWCGPCQVELSRLNKMMANGIIRNNELIAVNMQEDPKTISDYLDKNAYQFIVALDPQGLLAEQFKVQGTPTIIFIDETGIIQWITMGLSPTLELRVNNFLNKS